MRQADQLPVVDQPLHAGQDQLRGGVLGHVVVGTCLEAREHVCCRHADREHKHRDARKLPVARRVPADVQAIQVRQVHIQDDDVRPDLDRLLAPCRILG